MFDTVTFLPCALATLMRLANNSKVRLTFAIFGNNEQENNLTLEDKEFPIKVAPDEYTIHLSVSLRSIL